MNVGELSRLNFWNFDLNVEMNEWRYWIQRKPNNLNGMNGIISPFIFQCKGWYFPKLLLLYYCKPNFLIWMAGYLSPDHAWTCILVEKLFTEFSKHSRVSRWVPDFNYQHTFCGKMSLWFDDSMKRMESWSSKDVWVCSWSLNLYLRDLILMSNTVLFLQIMFL